MDLSPVQKKIFQYFENQILEYGEMPTLRKAAEDNGVSHAAIAQTVKVLEKKGISGVMGGMAGKLICSRRWMKPLCLSECVTCLLWVP